MKKKNIKPREIKIYPELSEAMEWLKNNIGKSEQDKVNVAGDALRHMADSDKLLYMAAVGLVNIVHLIEYENYIEDKKIPHVMSATAFIASKATSDQEAKKRRETAKAAASVANNKKAVHANKRNYVWQTKATEIWREAGRASSTKTHVARLMQNRGVDGCADHDIKFIAGKITKP